jgi:hypothetical protein
MGLGVSLILVAVGAILIWAVDVSTSGVNVQAVGVVLLIVGLVGGLISMIFWSSWAGPGYFTRRRTTYRRRAVAKRSEGMLLRSITPGVAPTGARR